MRYSCEMSSIIVKKLLQERSELLTELGSLAKLLRGSWVERYSVCSRPHCKCHKGERHGPRYYLVVNEQGRQRQKYIPKAQVDTVRLGIEQHRQLLEIVNQITQINVRLIREGEYGKD